MSATVSSGNTAQCSPLFALSESSSGAPSTVSESRFLTSFILHPTVVLAWSVRYLSSCFCLIVTVGARVGKITMPYLSTHLYSLTGSNTEQSWISVVLWKLAYFYLLDDIRWFLTLAWISLPVGKKKKKTGWWHK